MLRKLFSFCILSCGILLPRGFAAPIVVDPMASTFTGVEVADTVLNFSSTSPDVSGTLEQRVYQQTGGTLNFYYLLANNSSSALPVVRLTSSDFATFGVAVADLSIPVGGILPTEADRSAAGDIVGFDVFLLPGKNSAWLEISTSATAFGHTGTTEIIDFTGGIVGNLSTYSPIPVPEPLSLSLLAAGLAALGLLALCRARAREVVSA